MAMRCSMGASMGAAVQQKWGVNDAESRDKKQLHRLGVG